MMETTRHINQVEIAEEILVFHHWSPREREDFELQLFLRYKEIYEKY